MSSPSLETRYPWLLAIFIAALLISACGGTPDTRPRPLIDAETYLNAGTNAFYNDEYVYATEKFTRALELYLSVDHHAGIIDSRINLTECAIALGRYAEAQQQLVKIRSLQQTRHDQTVNTRLTFLQVKLLSRQGLQAAAIEALQTLLPGFNEGQRMVAAKQHSLNAVASMAHLASASGRDDAGLWITRFDLALQARENPSARHRALLLRLRAQQQLAGGNLQSSENLLQQALRLYQQIPYRRGIAITLQQMAQVAIIRDDQLYAEALLERALRIHLWTLNQDAAREVLRRLIDINQDLGRIARVTKYQAQLAELE